MHFTNFGALNGLHVDETTRFANDHDLLPLLTQVQQYDGERESAEYRQREPGIFVIACGVH